MAAVIESKTTVTFANLDEITFTPPSGIANGDLLFTVIGWEAAGSNIGSAPSGWTKLRSDSRSTVSSWIYYKVANSESGNYTWSWPAVGNRRRAGVMMRISGVASTFVSNAANVDNNANPSVACGVTPNAANSLLVMIMASEQNNNNVSGYAIVTSNPTWIEQLDEFDATVNISIAVATATRPEVTATGNASVTGMDTTADTVGQLVVIDVPIPVTVSVNVLDITASIQAPTITGASSFTASALDVTMSVPNPTISTPAPLWNNTAKNSASITNPDTKNAISPTNISKNSASWTNQSKS